MRKHKRFLSLMVVCIVLPFLSSCKKNAVTTDFQDVLTDESSVDSDSLRKASFLPYWVSTAQFAGYFVAKEMGIYKKFGIDLEIIPYQPFYTSSDLIKNGKADFAALWLINALQLRESGVEIVNIAQFSTRSSCMLVTKKSSGIDKIEKMNNEKLGVWVGFELQPQTLFKKYKLNVEIIPIGSTNNLFLKDGVKITIANWFDEYHSIINSGYDSTELNTFFFADYGLNFLEDGIYCLSDKMKKDPKLCSDFVKATAEGWRIAFENQDKALDIVIAYAKKSNLPVNRIHQKWMLERYKDLYYHNNQFSTLLSKKDYFFAANILFENGQISKVQPWEDFFMHYETSVNK